MMIISLHIDKASNKEREEGGSLPEIEVWWCHSGRRELLKFLEILIIMYLFR